MRGPIAVLLRQLMPAQPKSKPKKKTGGKK